MLPIFKVQDSWPLKLGPIGCSETSVRNYHYSLRNNPEVHSYHVYSNIYPTRCNVTQFILSGTCSTCFGLYLHSSSGAHTTVSTASGICAPDDEWRYHPKHVEQFPDKINCVTLHLVGYIYWNILTTHGPMNVKVVIYFTAEAWNQAEFNLLLSCLWQHTAQQIVVYN